MIGSAHFVSSLLVPPSIEDDVTTVTAVKMSPVVLPCHVQGRPQPTITWTKGGARLGARGGSYRVLPTGKTKCSHNKTIMPHSTDPVFLSHQMRHLIIHL